MIRARRELDTRARRRNALRDLRRVPDEHRLVSFAWPPGEPEDWQVLGDVDAGLEWVHECRRVLDACEAKLREASGGV
ncbi:MAG: hypothetical protein AB7F65_02865 [Dehalococcoidia bacterium]